MGSIRYRGRLSIRMRLQALARRKWSMPASHASGQGSTHACSDGGAGGALGSVADAIAVGSTRFGLRASSSRQTLVAIR
jgi:hypothetical protein